jgi:hypothetical protein
VNFGSRGQTSRYGIFWPQPRPKDEDLLSRGFIMADLSRSDGSYYLVHDVSNQIKSLRISAANNMLLSF